VEPLNVSKTAIPTRKRGGGDRHGICLFIESFSLHFWFAVPLTYVSRFLIISDRNATEKVDNQKMLYFPTASVYSRQLSRARGNEVTERKERRGVNKRLLIVGARALVLISEGWMALCLL